MIAKGKLLFLKITLYVDKCMGEGYIGLSSIEEVVHVDDIDSVREEIDKKFHDFDHNETFT